MGLLAVISSVLYFFLFFFLARSVAGVVEVEGCLGLVRVSVSPIPPRPRAHTPSADCCIAPTSFLLTTDGFSVLYVFGVV